MGRPARSTHRPPRIADAQYPPGALQLCELFRGTVYLTWTTGLTARATLKDQPSNSRTKSWRKRRPSSDKVRASDLSLQMHPKGNAPSERPAAERARLESGECATAFLDETKEVAMTAGHPQVPPHATPTRPRTNGQPQLRQPEQLRPLRLTVPPPAPPAVPPANSSARTRSRGQQQPAALVVLWVLVAVSGLIGALMFAFSTSRSSNSTQYALIGSALLTYCGLALLFALAVQALHRRT